MSTLSAPERARRDELFARGLKHCSRCEQSLPLEAFWVQGRAPYGLSSSCRECTSARRRKREGTHLPRHSGNLTWDEAERRRALAALGLKDCRGCKERLSLGDFPFQKKATDGRGPRCKSCVRFRQKEIGTWRRHLYGIGPDEYAAMREKQMGRCAICVEPLEGGRKEHLDHDHATGLIRGILCRRCNYVLGQVGDSPERLLDYVLYLCRHGR